MTPIEFISLININYDLGLNIDKEEVFLELSNSSEKFEGISELELYTYILREVRTDMLKIPNMRVYSILEQIEKYSTELIGQYKILASEYIRRVYVNREEIYKNKGSELALVTKRISEDKSFSSEVLELVAHKFKYYNHKHKTITLNNKVYNVNSTWLWQDLSLECILSDMVITISYSGLISGKKLGDLQKLGI